MAGVHQLPRRERPCHFLALLGASAVVFSVVGNPSSPATNAWCALAGFLMWLLGVARLLLFAQESGRGAPTVQAFRGSLAAPASPPAAESANPAVERPKHFLFDRQEPEPEPEPATASV